MDDTTLYILSALISGVSIGINLALLMLNRMEKKQ